MARAGADQRTFGLTVGGVLLGLGLFSLWRGHTLVGPTLAVPGGLLVLGGVLVPRWLAPVQRRWMAFAAVLGEINGRIILSVAYYVLVVPVGMVLRACGRDPLDRRLHSGDSYWHRRPPEPPPSPERYERQF